MGRPSPPKRQSRAREEVLQKAGKLPDAEVAFLLSGPRPGNSPPMTTQASTYLSEAQWSGMFALVGVTETFKPMIDDLEQNFEAWMEWSNCELPEDKVDGQLPGDWEGKLSLCTLVRTRTLVDPNATRVLRSTSVCVSRAAVPVPRHPRPRRAAVHGLTAAGSGWAGVL